METELPTLAGCIRDRRIQVLLPRLQRCDGYTKATIYWLLRRTYQKHSISRQAGLVGLVLPPSELG